MMTYANEASHNEGNSEWPSGCTCKLLSLKAPLLEAERGRELQSSFVTGVSVNVCCIFFVFVHAKSRCVYVCVLMFTLPIFQQAIHGLPMQLPKPMHLPSSRLLS